MSGNLNLLIKGKDTGRGGRIWRSQVWGGTDSSRGSFAQPLLFDTLKKGGMSPDAELDVVDFPWSPSPNLKNDPSTSNLTNQINQSLLEFDEMLDEFEADDEERALFTQSPTSLTPSRSLCNALSRSASKNLLMRRSSSLKRTEMTSNDNQEGIYEAIDDRVNIESGYATAEQESTASEMSNSITSASSGISGMGEKRRQVYGHLPTNFDTGNNYEEPDLNDPFIPLPPPPITIHFENPDDDLQDKIDERPIQESSFDYEAIMRKKKPKINNMDEGVGLSEYELQKLNKLLQDEETPSNDVSKNSSTLHVERSNTFIYQTNENYEDAEEHYGQHNNGDVMDEVEQYLDPNETDQHYNYEPELINDSENNFNDEENFSRLSNPSTLTNETPVFPNIPPPPDFIPPPPDFTPPPPPNYFPPPPQHFLEQETFTEDDTLQEDDRGDNESMTSYRNLDGVENYTINFGDETTGIYDLPDDAVQQYSDYDYKEPDNDQEPTFDNFDSFASAASPLPPPEDFSWTAGDPEEDGGCTSFPPPPPAPPPPPLDWSPPKYRTSECTHKKSESSDTCHAQFDMSALKESLSNIKLRKVSDEDLSNKSPQNNPVSDAVGMIAHMILSGAYKLKPSSAGSAIRNEGGTIKDSQDGDNLNSDNSELPSPPPPIDADDIYMNASEVGDPHDPQGRPPNEKCAPPPRSSNYDPVGLLNQKNQNVVEAPTKKTCNQNSNGSLNIDVSQIPGYQVVPDSAAPWKKDMIERKNQQLLEKFMEEKENRKLEQEKWRDVPEWKRNLLMGKEKKKCENPVISMFKPKQPPAVLKKSEAVANWKQRAGQNL